MGDLTRNFDRVEYECKDGCGFDDVSPKLANLVQEIRDELGKKIFIDSGCRCPTHNRRVKGVKNSGHLTGEAADIRAEGMVRSYFLIRFIKAMHDNGKLRDLTYCYCPGVYSVHVGVDRKPRKSIFVL
jgi:uncharacterized protein YcbK (DUF882 family)